MNHDNILWASPAIHTDGNVCVDVKAKQHGGVILGQLGETWLHDLHLTAGDARWLAWKLNQAAEESELAR